MPRHLGGRAKEWGIDNSPTVRAVTCVDLYVYTGIPKVPLTGGALTGRLYKPGDPASTRSLILTQIRNPESTFVSFRIIDQLNVWFKSISDWTGILMSLRSHNLHMRHSVVGLVYVCVSIPVSQSAFNVTYIWFKRSVNKHHINWTSQTTIFVFINI